MAEPRLPPGPRSPALFQTLGFLRDPLGTVSRNVQRYGEIFSLKLAGFQPSVMLTSPAHLKQLFTGPANVLHAGESNHTVFGPITGTHTAFVFDEESHLQRRRLLLPPFHGERMHEYADVMRRMTERAIASWKVGTTFPVHPETQQITLHVILRTVFGIADADPASPLVRSITRLVNEALTSPLLMFRPLRWNLGRFSPWGKVLHIVKQADEVMLAEIARRRAETEGGKHAGANDILALLLKVRDEEGKGLTDRELRDELTTMLLAGHETTGTALAWALECILARPEVLGRIVEESRAADLDADGKVAGREELARLEYLDAVIKESLRHRPIMSFGGTRLLKAPFPIGPYELPAGTYVSNCFSQLHRRPDLYPDPDEFRPERFLGKKVDPYEFTPFGGGVRRCLGMAFALFEMKVVLATLLTRARLELAGGPVRAVPRGFFLAPEGGLPVRYLGPLR